MKKECNTKNEDIADIVKNGLSSGRYKLIVDDRERCFNIFSWIFDFFMLIFRPSWTVIVTTSKEEDKNKPIEIKGFYVKKKVFSGHVGISLLGPLPNISGNVTINYDDEWDCVSLSPSLAKKLWNILTFDFRIDKNLIKREFDSRYNKVVEILRK
jgi:hypothetical protein